MRIQFISLFVLKILDSQSQSGFKQSQYIYPRVRQAYQEKGDALMTLLKTFDLDPGEIELYHQLPEVAFLRNGLHKIQ